jgi:hypothetical protein
MEKAVMNHRTPDPPVTFVRTAAFIPAAKNKTIFDMGIKAMWWNMPFTR